ncbi:hypothetical protein FQN52_003578 [Onygenales sp. PD_12]|nr:hypothetical protein FQN52_003578 [Onygenales sp. PD_12]
MTLSRPDKEFHQSSAKPLLIYHSAFPPSTFTSPSQISHHLATIGAVTPQWTYTMYPTSHFHSTTHEVLAIVSGAAKLCFGHEENPGKVEMTVSKGDVVIVPAGVAHRLLEDVEGRFLMVGAYPAGLGWDMCYGTEGEGDKTGVIGGLGWFGRDPVYGGCGPVLEV